MGIKEVICFACGRPINETEFPPSRKWAVQDGTNKVHVMCANCNHIEQTEEDSDEIVK